MRLASGNEHAVTETVIIDVFIAVVWIREVGEVC